MSHISLISLGANQHAPMRQLKLAFDAIAALPLTRIISSSPIIITEALGYVRQQDYYNQILSISTNLAPLGLLTHLQAIEKRLGRVRRVPWGPRMLDLDILDYDRLILNHPRLILPHPQMKTRAYIKELLEKMQSYLHS